MTLETVLCSVSLVLAEICYTYSAILICLWLWGGNFHVNFSMDNGRWVGKKNMLSVLQKVVMRKRVWNSSHFMICSKYYLFAVSLRCYVHLPGRDALSTYWVSNRTCRFSGVYQCLNVIVYVIASITVTLSGIGTAATFFSVCYKLRMENLESMYYYMFLLIWKQNC